MITMGGCMTAQDIAGLTSGSPPGGSGQISGLRVEQAIPLAVRHPDPLSPCAGRSPVLIAEVPERVDAQADEPPDEPLNA